MRQQLLVRGNKRVTCVIYLIEKSFTSQTMGISFAEFHVTMIVHEMEAIWCGDFILEKGHFAQGTDF